MTNEKDAIDSRITTAKVQLDSLDYNFQQLILLNLAEDYFKLAEIHFEDENWKATKEALTESSSHFIRGFRYKKYPLRERHPEGAIKVNDKAMNPERGLRSLLIALILGDSENIKEAAKLIWDPPFCNHIGPGGACSYEEQKLAHSYRDFVLQENQEAAVEDLQTIIESSGHLSQSAQFLKVIFETNGQVPVNLIDNWIEQVNSNASLNLVLLGNISIATRLENSDLLNKLDCSELIE